MGVENPTYISDFNVLWPDGGDGKNTLDNHARNMKLAIKTTFPNITGAVTVTHTQLNTVTAKGDIAGQTWTGTHTFPSSTYGVTASLGDSSTKLATTAFVAGTAFSSALPAQTGNSGKIITTNGTTASWTSVKTVNGSSILGSGDILVGMKLLAELTPTAAANVDFLSTFTSSYDNYAIIGTNIRNNTGTNDTMLARMAVSGAADTGSNYIAINESSSTTTTSTNFDTGVVYGVSGIGSNFVINIKNANGTTSTKSADCRSESCNSGSAYLKADKATVYTGTSAISGLRLYWSGGSNFSATGKIRVYGYQNS